MSRVEGTSEPAEPARRKRPDRERIMRTLTFWLRPDFVLRVLARFQKIAGFDRSVALASSALTALVPLAIVASSISDKLGGKDTAQRIIERYDLTGGGAEAVEEIFGPSAAPSTGIGVMGAFFLLLALLSFARAAQRLFEQTWELKPLSVRNSLNGLLWIGGMTVYLVISGTLQAFLEDDSVALTATLISAPLAAAFYAWSGRTLSAKRITWSELLPFGIVAAALSFLYSIGAQVYLPHLFSTYATRYGVMGAVFALISALFCIAVIVTVSAAVGREVAAELERIRRGERPAEADVRRQWDELTAEARSRWELVRSRTRRRG